MEMASSPLKSQLAARGRQAVKSKKRGGGGGGGREAPSTAEFSLPPELRKTEILQ